jgi:hypothetical protein
MPRSANCTVEPISADLGIPIGAARQLRQIVRPHREPIEHVGEGIDPDDVVVDFAHHVDLRSLWVREAERRSQAKAA